MDILFSWKKSKLRFLQVFTFQAPPMSKKVFFKWKSPKDYKKSVRASGSMRLLLTKTTPFLLPCCLPTRFPSIIILGDEALAIAVLTTIIVIEFHSDAVLINLSSNWSINLITVSGVGRSPNLSRNISRVCVCGHFPS